jgi:hypothetical protein
LFNLHARHFFKHQGSGNRSNFSCEEKHKSDKTKALEYFSQWISNVKEKLLIKLSSVLTIFNDQNVENISDQSHQSTLTPSMLPQHFPSLLFVKTALHLGKVNLTKIMDRSSNFKSEMSRPTGEALGLMVWKSRNEVHKKKEKLENPNSLDNYRCGFPFFLMEFFDGLIFVLERKKNEILNKK